MGQVARTALRLKYFSAQQIKICNLQSNLTCPTVGITACQIKGDFQWAPKNFIERHIKIIHKSQYHIFLVMQSIQKILGWALFLQSALLLGCFGWFWGRFAFNPSLEGGLPLF